MDASRCEAIELRTPFHHHLPFLPFFVNVVGIELVYAQLFNGFLCL